MKIIIGISGASGVVLGYKLLKLLKENEECETHLVISNGAKMTFGLETDLKISDVESLADFVYDNRNIGALIASGSFKTAGMIIVPCSMKTLAGISTGYTDNLLLRAADVCLKENRKLVLVPREMPLGKKHIMNLLEVSNLGCTIIPPMLTFYNGAKSMDDQINHILGKILMQFDIESKEFIPWTGNRFKQS